MANFINLGSKVLFKIPTGKAFSGDFKIAIGTLQSYEMGGVDPDSANQDPGCVERCEIEYNGLIYSNRRRDIRKDTPKNRSNLKKRGHEIRECL